MRVRGKILDRLGDYLDGSENQRIFDVEKRPDGTFRLTEACDGYFYVDLTAAELKGLGDELIAAAVAI